MLLTDKNIRQLCNGVDNRTSIDFIKIIVDNGVFLRKISAGEKPMIEPFIGELTKVITKEGSDTPVISYGLSSMGYDVRLGDEVEIFTNANAKIIDPMKHDNDCLMKAKINIDENGLRYFILPANSYALGHTLETFNIPRDILVTVLGKSTYARAAVGINTTPIEPGFEGQVVIEMTNGCSSPVKIYLDGGIAQFIFQVGLDECEVSYADRQGKYQGQQGITHSKV
ncbi:MAG: dCTP deaminase [Gammaproteobacteria bacterium]|nr:dCTP deaminase [Gammaproteobacteria bacterium]